VDVAGGAAIVMLEAAGAGGAAIALLLFVVDVDVFAVFPAVALVAGGATAAGIILGAVETSAEMEMEGATGEGEAAT